jgi:membrane protein DedA with SNARE-associated domain
MEALAPGWIYVTIVVVAYMENIVPPVPGDMLIVFAGYLVGIGQLSMLPVILLAALGGTAGFLTMFAVGWTVGSAVFDVDRMRWVPKAPAHRVRAWILKYGYAVVFTNRFLAGARSVISLAVGAARMDPGRVALWAGVSSLLWCTGIVLLGFFVGDQWAIIGEYLRMYGEWLLGALILSLVVYAIVRLRRARLARRRRRRSGEDPVAGAKRPDGH